MATPGAMTHPGVSLHARQGAPIALDADLACEPGRTLALVGPSGSGKTTLLRTIAGLYTPGVARVDCRGACWTDTERGVSVPTRARAVGVVFQHYALFPHLSAEQNVAAALSHLAPRDRVPRARRLLAQVHLEGLEDRRPAALSGGQQQRVAMARALARDPHVLLLDEPFAAVDKVTRRKLYLELAELRRTLAIPVLLVTHDLDEAAMLSDAMTILHRGQTLQTGAPGDVLTRPATVDVARLVDLPNVHAGQLVADAGAPNGVRLAWDGILLEVQRTGGHRAGERVWWSIPEDAVILHRVDRPSRGERENPVTGVLVTCIPLGAHVSLGIEVQGDSRRILRTSMSAHVAERNGLRAGRTITVSLLANEIHLMPWGPAEAAAATAPDRHGHRR